MECHVSETGDFVRALVGPGTPEHVRECYRQIAALCLKHNVSRALVVSITGDPTDYVALTDALQTLAEAGLPPRFKLALASSERESYRLYQLAETIAGRRGIVARAFEEVESALRWLDE